MARAIEMEELYGETAEIIDNPESSTEEKFMQIYMGNMLEFQQRMQAMDILNYLSEASETTLLIPAESRSKKVDKAMERWKYSPIEYQSQAAIEQKRDASEPGYAYLRSQTGGSAMAAVVNFMLVSTDQDRVLHTHQSMQMGGNIDRTDQVLLDMVRDIDAKSKNYDPDATVVFTATELEEAIQGLPRDLSSSKLGFVRVPNRPHPFSLQINRVFRKKVEKDYPYEFVMVDKSSQLKGCKYRVRLKSYVSSYTKTYRERLNPGRAESHFRNRNDYYYVPGYISYLLIEDIETGQTYVFQDEPEEIGDAVKRLMDKVK